MLLSSSQKRLLYRILGWQGEHEHGRGSYELTPAELVIRKLIELGVIRVHVSELARALLEINPPRKPDVLPHDELWQAKADCKGSVIHAPGGGVKCTGCHGWYCL